MSLTDKLKQIMALQGLSEEISRQEKDKAALALDVAEQRALIERVEARRGEARAVRIEAHKEADAAELKVREIEATIGKLETQLNVTKHQGDYDVIRNSVLSHKADISHSEDTGLACLQKVEDMEKQEERLTAEIEAQKGKLQEMEEQVRQQTAEYDQRIHGLNVRRDATRAAIDEKLLDEYERLARSRGNTALATAKGRICQGCHSMITKQTENLLMRDNEIVTCPNCGRLLMRDDSSE